MKEWKLKKKTNEERVIRIKSLLKSGLSLLSELVLEVVEVSIVSPVI